MWVNSDTAGDAVGIPQYIAFPQGLISNQYPYHSRLTATILSYLPFHTVGYAYNAITDNPTNSLYVTQGFMVGVVFIIYVLVSSAYIIPQETKFSWAYLLCVALILMVTMSLPISTLDQYISLAVRFRHQSVVNHYVGTLSIALIVLYPYWRYLINGGWNDWYNNNVLKVLYYTLIMAAVFSSTGTMVWLGVISGFALIAIFITNHHKNLPNPQNINQQIQALLKNQLTHPFIFILILAVMGTLAESMSHRTATSFSSFNPVEYLKVLFLFFSQSKEFLILIPVSALLLLLLNNNIKNKVTSKNLVLLKSIFPWLLIANIVYIAIIGIPRVSYRFHGYNLGPDTALPATWTTTLWLLAVMISFWKESKYLWLAPLFLFSLSTNALNYFNFHKDHAYKIKSDQQMVFNTLYSQNKTLDNNIIIPVPFENVAFSEGELTSYTIPLLRDYGILSPNRKIQIVSLASFRQWAQNPLQTQQTVLTTGKRITTDDSAEAGDFLKYGWSTPEPWGTWSQSEKTQILLPLKFVPQTVILEFRPFLSAQNPVQNMDITINGTPAGHYTLTEAKTNAEITIPIPDQLKSAIRESGKVLLELSLPNAASPKELGISDDTRKLAVGLVAITVKD